MKATVENDYGNDETVSSEDESASGEETNDSDKGGRRWEDRG